MSSKDNDDHYTAINEKDQEDQKPDKSQDEGYERANDCLPCGKLCGKEQIRSQLIVEDSFVDDFSCKQMCTSLKTTYRESKQTKAEALAKSKKQKDSNVQKDADQLLWRLIGQQWPWLLLGAPFMFAGSLIEFLMPDFIGKSVNAIKEGNFTGEGGVNELIVMSLIVTAITATCSFFRELIFGVTSEKLGRSLRIELFESIMRKDIAFYDNVRTGEILSRLGSDTQVVQDGLTTNVSMLVKSLCLIIGCLFILVSYNVPLGFICIALMTPQIVVTRISWHFLQLFMLQAQKAKSEMSNTATEQIQNIRTVKAFADEEMSGLKFQYQSQKVFDYGRTRGYLWAFFFLGISFLKPLAETAIVFIIARNFYELDLTVGEVTAIMLYVRTVMLNTSNIANNIQAVAKVYGASYEIAVLIVTPNKVEHNGTEKPDDYIEKEGKCNIELEDVKFSYPTKMNVPVLKGVNITVCKNQVVALVGHSGCGKSSIISLLERFYDPIEGRLLFSGYDLKDLDNTWYHQKQIALVQQEPILFSCSIRDNILYGVDVSGMTEQQIQERLEEACRQANALTFIKDELLFPEGFNSLVGERGVRLSGGQKQRIAIARALVRQPKVILLDEATSALDAESEHQVQEALDQLIKAGTQTCIVIAHRLSTIRDADKIIVLRKGDVIEQGSHDELVAKDGAYKKLVQRQLMTEELGEQVKKGQKGQ